MVLPWIAFISLVSLSVGTYVVHCDNCCKNKDLTGMVGLMNITMSQLMELVCIDCQTSPGSLVLVMC